MDYLRNKNTITPEEIEGIFFEFMDKRKIYLYCGMNTPKASLIMGVPIEKLNAYTMNDYAVLFESVIHNYRIGDAEDLWSELPHLSIFKMAKSVGYANVVEFLYHFILQNKCMPFVWKRKFGII